MSVAHLARGATGGADFRRILDQLDSERNLVTLVCPLVVAKRGRPLFSTLDGIGRIQEQTFVRGGDHSIDTNHVRRTSQALQHPAISVRAKLGFRDTLRDIPWGLLQSVLRLSC